MKTLILVSALILTACAHQKSKPVALKKSNTAVQPQVGKATNSTKMKSPVVLSRDAKEAAELKKERSQILMKKNAHLVQARPQNKKVTLNIEPLRVKNISENKLMEELMTRYEQNDEIGFQSRYQALQQNFPKSARLNEAHYMSGLMSLSNKDYGRALKGFDKVIKKSPRSPQAPKALFAKAITYKRMNLAAASRDLLRDVQARYPKTIESQRAALELKIQESRFQ